MSQRCTLNRDFFKKWSPEMAYVLGFFAADGSMLKNRRGGCFIEFTSTDRIVLEVIQRATTSSHHIAARERGDNRKTAYRLQIGSKKWFADLARLGFTQHKSNTLRFPKVPAQFLGDFVRGYFDGDGCAYFNKLQFADRKGKRWILMSLFTSGSLGFLESLHHALTLHGVRGGSIKRKTRGFELVLSHRDSVALYHLMYHTGFASNLYLPRKRRKLERALKVLRLDN